MRLQQYITEGKYISFLDIAQLLYKEARPFMKDLGTKVKGYMLSGRKSEKSDYFIKHVRQDRQPRDTLSHIHNELDRRFQEKFGWKARSQSLFVTGSYGDAKSYGKVYIIIPIGDYKFIWSDKVEDLLTYMRNNYIRRNDIVNDEDYDELIGFYTDKDLSKAIDYNNEIMLGAKKVIGIEYNHYSKYLNKFIQYQDWSKQPTVRMMEDFIEKMGLQGDRENIL